MNQVLGHTAASDRWGIAPMLILGEDVSEPPTVRAVRTPIAPACAAGGQEIAVGFGEEEQGGSFSTGKPLGVEWQH
ncbi:MAG: hypothetical protein U9R72_16160 [Chloroflexota bacterium]|nr:hypothetical protein [Chloroflexota bacterium]